MKKNKRTKNCSCNSKSVDNTMDFNNESMNKILKTECGCGHGCTNDKNPENNNAEFSEDLALFGLAMGAANNMSGMGMGAGLGAAMGMGAGMGAGMAGLYGINAVDNYTESAGDDYFENESSENLVDSYDSIIDEHNAEMLEIAADESYYDQNNTGELYTMIPDPNDENMNSMNES